MGMRICFAGASQMNRREVRETVVAEVKRRMLASDDQRRRKSARCQRVGDGSEFDGFGPGADDQRDVGRTQPSP